MKADTKEISDAEIDRRLEVFREAAEIKAEMDKTRQGED